MRPREDELIDPEIAEQLDAIDATLAGDPVDPRFAELAELALLLAAARPEPMRPGFADEIDRCVEARFRRGGAGAPGSASSLASGAAADSAGALGGALGGGRGRGRARRWRVTPAWGAAGTALAAVVIGIAVVSSVDGSPSFRRSPADAAGVALLAPHTIGRAGSSSSGNTNGSAQSIAPGPNTPAGQAGPNVQSPASARPQRSAAPVAGAKSAAAPHGSATGASESSPAAGGSGAAVASPAIPSPAPIPNGRKIVQSSSLQLGTPARRIDAVAQEVFQVVSEFGGIVDSSSVASTGGPGASAQFQLRIPSGALAQALSALSSLRYANVISRIDNTQDVNSSFVSARRQIADARSALTGLRAKLAAATIETEIVSLRAQIASEEATIKRAHSSLHSLNRRVNYSDVDVAVVADGGVSPSASGGGFGLHQAGHDALRVLEVSAGVALIVLAVLIPIGLLAAVAAWVGLGVQRRRRERALDLA